MRTLTYPPTSLFPSLGRDISILTLDYADAEDLLQLRRTSSVADEYVVAALSHRVRRVVTPAVADYVAFANIMHLSSSVISGIAALYILYPRYGRPPFATIYTPEDTFAFVLSYLVEVEDFTIVPMPGHDGVFPRGVSVAVRLSKGGFIFDVAQSTTISPLLPLTSQFNSALFNYVSSTWFSSAYPTLTQTGRALLNPYCLDAYRIIPVEMRIQIAIWERNGWEFETQPNMFSNAGTCDGRASADCAVAVRAFGDEHCIEGTVI